MTQDDVPFAPERRPCLAMLIVDQGDDQAVAERVQCSPATAANLAARFQVSEPIRDRFSCPHR